jgi:hypothetical protein
MQTKQPVVPFFILLLVFLASCAPAVDSGLAGVTLERSALFTFSIPAAENGTITPESVGGRILVRSDNRSDILKLTVFGRNASVALREEVTGFNLTNAYTTNTTWTRVDRLSLNATPLGTVTVSDNATGNVIAVFAPGETLLYNSAQYNGVSFAPPLITANATVEVSKATEYVLYTGCNATTAGFGITYSYWVSPDNERWYPGAVSVPLCNMTGGFVGNKTTLTDAGVGYLRLQVSNPDNASNNLYARLSYR